MAGHSKWHQIRRKKELTDQKRGQSFSKVLRAISVAAKGEPNPEFNPRLRAAVEKAKQLNVPQENIEKAISRTSVQAGDFEEITVEVYGPGGTAFIVEAVTDNKNRTVQEIKNILRDGGGRLGGPHSVLWAFTNENGEWKPKFKQETSEENKDKAEKLIRSLEEQGDVQKIYTNL